MLKKVRKDIDKKRGILYSIDVAYHMYAALAHCANLIIRRMNLSSFTLPEPTAKALYLHTPPLF